MDPITIGFGLACIAVLAIDMAAWLRKSGGCGDAVACAGILLMTWAASNVMVALYTPPAAYLLYPITDAMAGATVMWMWFTKRARWKLVLVGLFLLQCILHVAFWLHEDKSYGVLYAYVLGINISFGLQLLVTAWPGGEHVVAGIADLFRGPRRTYIRHSVLPRSR